MIGNDVASKLARFETVLLDLPTIRPHVLVMATMRVQSIVLVRLTGSDAVEGIGEGTTIGGVSYGPESPEGIKLVIDRYIAPLLEGEDLTRVGAVMAKINKHVSGNNIAKCAVETALLDAQARRFGVAVSELISGGRVRAHLPVAWTLASGDTGRDIEEAQEMLAARRHKIFKLKIGKRDVRADVAHVAAIKKALGERVSVRVDVNQGWSETQAELGMSLLAEAGVDLVEQPVMRGSGAMARLSARHGVPIMADESLHGAQDGFVVAAGAQARVFAIKIAQSGGLIPANDVARIGHAAGLGLYGGTMLEAGVGTAASAQLCATLPNLEWGTELFGSLLVQEDILAEPLRYADFSLQVPEGPGLGVHLDEAKVAYFRRDRTAPLLHAVATKGEANAVSG